jgi:hypothetical protein
MFLTSLLKSSEFRRLLLIVLRERMQKKRGIEVLGKELRKSLYC